MSSTESGTETVKQIKRKRGVRNTDTYKQQKIKLAKLHGESYTSYSGKEIPARKSECKCTCTLKCSKVFDDTACMSILKKFNEFECKNNQDTYLQGLLEVQPVKTHRPRKGDAAAVREHTVIYSAEKNGQRIRVCKSAFLCLYSVSSKRVHRLVSLLKVGKSPQDGRGKNVNSRTKAVPYQVCEMVAAHIESFEVKDAHYSKGPIKYLNAQLNVKIMHTLFKQKYPDANVSYWFYHKYFHENYSLKFGRPQVDVCSKCEELKTKLKSSLNDSAKRAAAAELMVHTRRYQKFYRKLREIKETCAENNDVVGITIDYMQNVPLPHIPVQEVFYYRQLWVFVFGINNLKTGQSDFHLYHEGVGQKGPNEVCTLLNKYIDSNVPPTTKELHIFSDGCAAQNRNHAMVRFLLTLAATKRFEKIFHYFPVRGHSFLPCDRDFAVIKKKLRRVYVPDEYTRYVAEASSACKFTSTLHETNFSIDFKSWWPKFFKKNPLSIESYGKGVPKEEKVTFQVSNYSMFEYKSAKPGIVSARNYIDGIPIHTFRLTLNDGRIPDLPKDKAYRDQYPVSINIKKLQDVTKLMQYVPEEYKAFYDDIMKWKTTEYEEDGDVNEAY